MANFPSLYPSSSQSCLSPNNPFIKPLKPHIFIVKYETSMLVFNDFNTCFSSWSVSNLDLRGKKILIFIGGFTSQLEDHLTILSNTALKTKRFYDAIFFYSYPSGSTFHYLEARETARGTPAEGLRAVINNFWQSRIDIVAFSMGVHLTVNALNGYIFVKIQSLHLLGGAEDQDSLNDCSGQNCTQYSQTLKNASNIYVYATCQDWVLPFHTFAIGKRPLGYPKKWEETLAKNVSVIDATRVVDGHGDFLKNDAVFNAISFLSNHSLMFGAYALEENGNLKRTDRKVTCLNSLQ